MNENLKMALFELMDSHSKLANAEYQRDNTYNNDHFSYKAEESMISYLNENEPEVFDEFLQRGKK